MNLLLFLMMILSLKNEVYPFDVKIEHVTSEKLARCFKEVSSIYNDSF